MTTTKQLIGDTYCDVAEDGTVNPVPELVAFIDGVNTGDGIGMDAEHPVGGREGVHIIAAHDGIVPVAEVYSYGAHGSRDDEPEMHVSERELKDLAVLFARSPRIANAARAAYAVSCRVPCDPELSNAMGELFRALEGIES